MKSALFFSSVLGHKKFRDRYEALVQSGYDVTVVALQWNYGRTVPASAPPNSLLIPRDARLTILGRLKIWVQLTWLIWFNLPKKRFDLVIANTLEMTLFAEFAVRAPARKFF